MRIQLKDITMKFNDVTAVDRLNVAFEEGKLVSLLGPSGCGKSTTLFMLAGLYKPTSGQLYFGDRLVNKVEPEDREIGMVFQNYALYPHMSVLKNIMFPLKMAKVSKREATDRAMEMANLVQIGHLINRKPSQLSGGQQQRVAIARALVKRPKLLLLDEPLSNLDARLRLEMREEIRRIQQEVGITTIFVTHDQEEAMSISDQVLLMKDGKLQQHMAPQFMYDNPANLFVAEFLGNPPINKLEVVINKKTRTIAFKDTEETLPIPESYHFEQLTDGNFILGVRPEDWFIDNENGITAKINLIERIGRDTLITAVIGSSQIRLLVAPDLDVNVEDQIKLNARLNRAHLFNQETGEHLLQAGRASL